MSEQRAALRPYLAVLTVAVIIGVALAVYVAISWNEIRPMLTQSPT